jgi:hypothetical protein
MILTPKDKLHFTVRMATDALLIRGDLTDDLTGYFSSFVIL